MAKVAENKSEDQSITISERTKLDTLNRRGHREVGGKKQHCTGGGKMSESNRGVFSQTEDKCKGNTRLVQGSVPQRPGAHRAKPRTRGPEPLRGHWDGSGVAVPGKGIVCDFFGDFDKEGEKNDSRREERRERQARNRIRTQKREWGGNRGQQRGKGPKDQNLKNG